MSVKITVTETGDDSVIVKQGDLFTIGNDLYLTVHLAPLGDHLNLFFVCMDGGRWSDNPQGLSLTRRGLRELISKSSEEPVKFVGRADVQVTK